MTAPVLHPTQINTLYNMMSKCMVILKLYDLVDINVILTLNVNTV